MKNKKEEIKEKKDNNCGCGETCNCNDKGCTCEDENCTCGDDCECDETCTCGCENDKCTCGCEDENCECGCEDDDCECGENCTCEDKNYKILYLNEQQKSDEYLNLAKRYGADLENYKKRNAEIAIKEREEGIVSAIEKLLPAIDALDRANTLVDDESSLKGLDLIKKEMLANLENLGVKVIDSVGLIFDPNFHNAIASIEDKKQKSGTIIEEYQKGYTFNGRVIRFSIVKVVK